MRLMQNVPYYLTPEKMAVVQAMSQDHEGNLAGDYCHFDDAAGVILRRSDSDSEIAGSFIDEDGKRLGCSNHSSYCMRFYLNKTDELTAADFKKEPPEKPKDSQITLEDVILPRGHTEKIRAAVHGAKPEIMQRILTDWGLGKTLEKGLATALLFYGVPGTGKTLAAEAIGNELGRRVKLVQSGDIQSPMPGKTEKLIREFFKEAQKKNHVLLFDECDSVIAPRDEVGMILGAEINTILTCLERFTGVAIFTTNRLGRMDPAFSRRLALTLNFPFPDQAARELIWRRLLPDNCPISEDVRIEELAAFEIAGGNIKNALLSAARLAAWRDQKSITGDCFAESIEAELASIEAFKTAAAQDHRRPRQVGLTKNATA